MTIKEIAGLAGVSISTVSKIMNGKDASISQETREKVLNIAKEYNYSPYADVITGSGAKRFLLGVILEGGEEDAALFQGINRYAGQNGYSVIYCQHGGCREEELKAVMRLEHQKVDGVIWNRVAPDSIREKNCFEKSGIPVCYCDAFESDGINNVYNLDYGRLAYEAAQYLIDCKHTKLGCLYTGAKQEERFVKGFQRCLYDNHMEFKEAVCKKWSPEFSLSEYLLYGITGIVCLKEEAAGDILKKAAQSSYKVPMDVSVITIGNSSAGNLTSPTLTMIEPPWMELGEFLAVHLINAIESRTIESSEFIQPLRFYKGTSVDVVSSNRKKKIVSVGAINMDAVITVHEKAETGQTVIADGYTSLPGGKGANQAVGAAKMGADVYLIGKVGQDYEAKILRDALFQSGVDMSGVMETSVYGTGKAYITVQKGGESSIVVYPGANKTLNKEDILQNSHVFEDAVFCLLQLETPLSTVEYAARTAKSKGAMVMLKPAAAREISDYLLKKTDVFIPNEKELGLLLPDVRTIEEKAQYFMDKGVRHVIVTLGKKGCYLRNAETSLYFSAADFEAVDTTGAADAFISALAVFWAEGLDLNLAIKYATYAAGLSVTRQGTQSSMVDRIVLEMYGEEIDSNIKTSTVKMYE